MNYFKAWWNTKNLKEGDKLSPEQFQELGYIMRKDSQIKNFLSISWTIITGIATIVAAIFSVLAFLK